MFQTHKKSGYIQRTKFCVTTTLDVSLLFGYFIFDTTVLKVHLIQSRYVQGVYTFMKDVRYYGKQYDIRCLKNTSFFIYETDRREIASNECSKVDYDNYLLFTILHVLSCRCNMNKNYN